MGKYITNAGLSLHPAPRSPARATLDQYLSHEKCPQLGGNSCHRGGPHSAQLSGISVVKTEIWDICILQSVLLTQRILRPEGFMHQMQPSLMLALNHHLALGGFQHLGNMNMDQCSLSSSPSPCPCLGHALCLHLQLQGLQIPIKI